MQFRDLTEQKELIPFFCFETCLHMQAWRSMPHPTSNQEPQRSTPMRQEGRKGHEAVGIAEYFEGI